MAGRSLSRAANDDPEDETMLDTALREVREELGLIVARNDVLAELPMEQTRTTGYRVFPFLARIAVPDRWQIAEREIAEIVDVKLSDLIRRRCPRQNDRPFPDLEESRSRFRFIKLASIGFGACPIGFLQPVIPRLVAGEWDV